ncbi:MULTISPECIES: hypothetical protein [Miniimonas]|uniref:hypothetical protein n=1 Tax=Miniimonas TaxID=947525 RepID=UPI001F453DC9|nr:MULTISPECIES: hypothetical protein [Miniimonas]
MTFWVTSWRVSEPHQANRIVTGSLSASALASALESPPAASPVASALESPPVSLLPQADRPSVRARAAATAPTTRREVWGMVILFSFGPTASLRAVNGVTGGSRRSC